MSLCLPSINILFHILFFHFPGFYLHFCEDENRQGWRWDTFCGVNRRRRLNEGKEEGKINFSTLRKIKSKFFNDFFPCHALATFNIVKYSSLFTSCSSTGLVLNRCLINGSVLNIHAHRYKKLCIIWKGILSFRFFLPRAECLKTKMSLFFHFLLFYDTIDDEKKNSAPKYVEGKKGKSL